MFFIEWDNDLNDKIRSNFYRQEMVLYVFSAPRKDIFNVALDIRYLYNVVDCC